MLRLLYNWLPAVGPVAFFTTEHYALGAIATVVYLASLLSVLLMRVAAWDNARFRVYAQAKGEPFEHQPGPQGLLNLRSLMPNNPEMLASIERIKEEDELERDPGFVHLREWLRQNPSVLYISPEVQARLDVIPIALTRSDAEQVSDRLSVMHMVTTLAAMALAVWGIALWLR